MQNAQVNEGPAHHPYGMSQWPAMLECPRFEGRGDSKDAEKGTETHKAFAWQLEALLDGASPDEAIAADYHEKGAHRAAKNVFDLWTLDQGAGEVHIETRVSLNTPNGEIFGTADCYWVNLEKKEVTVVDFKTFRNSGRDYTPQLVGYGLAVARTIAKEGVRIRTIVCYGDDPGMVHATGTQEVAERILGQVLKVAAGRVTGCLQPRQCNWCDVCKHFPTCAACVAVAKRQTEIAKKELTWDTLTADKKAQYCAMADWMAKWAAAVKDKAKEDLVAGMKVEDPDNGISYTLQKASGKKTPRVNDLWPAMRDQGVNAADFRAALTISASAAEGLLKAIGMKAKDAKALVAEYCDEGAGSVRMVRAK